MDMPVLLRSETSDTNEVLNDMVMFVEHAKDLQRDGIKPRQRQVIFKRSHKPVYGKSHNNKLKSVVTHTGTCGRASRTWPSRVGRRGLLAPRN